MNRRIFLRRAGFVAGAALLSKSSAGFGSAAAHPNPFKLAAISDCVSPDFEDALKIMKGYGLSWVEIRHLWGKYNTETTPAEIRRAKDLLDKYQFQCSQVDTALFKCKLPGTQPIAGNALIYSYPEQMDLLKQAIDRAHAWGTDKVRIFSFWRVAEPEAIFGRVHDELQRAAEVAKSADIRLLIEDEYDCNVGSGRELARMLSALPSNVGANWDIGNGLWLGEVTYPDGYKNLNPKRIWNLHLKGVQCGEGFKDCKETFPDQGQIDLVGQLRALLRDRYRETISIECEFKAPGLNQLETTQRALAGMLKIISEAATEHNS